jgi:hypothetical protein
VVNYKEQLLYFNDLLSEPFIGSDSDILKGVLQHLEKIRSTNDGTPYKHKLQHYLSELSFQVRKQGIIDLLTNNELFWLNKSVADITSSIWLDAIPITSQLKFDNYEFRYALSYKFQIPFKDYVDGSVCYCSNKIPYDNVGHHFVAGCYKDGCRVDRHNKLVNTLHYILSRYCGICSTKEERDCLVTVDKPNSKERPDLSISEAITDLNFGKELIDVSVTSALSGVAKGNIKQVTREQAQDKKFLFKAVEETAKEKNNKYIKKAHENQCAFAPFILDINGCLNNKGKQFIVKLSSRAEAIKKIPAKTLKNYFLKLISASLQKSNGSIIHFKLLKSKTKLSAELFDSGYGEDEQVADHDNTR